MASAAREYRYAHREFSTNGSLARDLKFRRTGAALGGILKGPLHNAVLQRMEGDDGQPAAGVQAVNGSAEHGRQGVQLAVDGNTGLLYASGWSHKKEIRVYDVQMSQSGSIISARILPKSFIGYLQSEFYMCFRTKKGRILCVLFGTD